MTGKSLDTLIDDIHNLFGGSYAVSPERAEAFGKDLSTILANRLAEPAEREHSTALRMSSLGKCETKLYLDSHSDEAQEELTPQTRLKFLYGDIIEALLLFLCKEAGHEVANEQAEVIVNGVVGHIDATIDGVVVDVKSASSRSFEKFKSGALVEDDPFGYMEQIAGYSAALGLPGAFLAMNKETAALTVLKFDRSFLQTYAICDRIDKLRDQAGQPLPPERPYHAIESGKSGNMQIPRSPCGYCSRKHECWSDANNGYGLRTFLYASGPVHLTEVVNEPKVPEAVSRK